MARTIAKDYDQKRADILKTAARLFANEGFDRASMNQLARECGISKANIYHYYDSKDALLFGVLDTYLANLRDRICNIDLDGLAPDATLRRTVSEVLLAYQGMDHEHQVQITAISALSTDRQEILRQYQRDMVRHMSEVIRAIAPQIFENNARKLRATTMSIFGMLNWFYMWNRKADVTAREDYANLVSNLALNGIHGL